MIAPRARTAIVTGAGKRVGAKVASALVSAGWTVVAHVHHDGDDVPAGTHKVVADLRDADCAEVIFHATNGLPPVRLLVNNAGRFAWDGFGEFNSSEFDAHMAINARAPALLIERLAKDHDNNSDALIVNMLDSKLAAPNADFLSYTLSKYALSALTEVAARALAPRRIRVNAIAPALMLQSSGQGDANFNRMHANNPLGRGVEPEDVIAAIDFLVGAATVTGQTLILDSGHRFMALGRDVQFLDDL